MKCAKCSREIETIFLGKIAGTYLRTNGKKKAVCSGCQRAYSVEELHTSL